MGALNITKRGKVYQYQFEAGKINGKRKRINKSGFKTKKEAEEAGAKAYNEFKNCGLIFKENNISYADYLDYWLENYCKTNLRYNTIQAYTTGFIKYNPTLTLRLPKIEDYREDIKHIYSQEEIDLILNRFKNNDTFTCAFLTSCYTGMRTGEVFALTWDDIDLNNGVISIKHSVYDKPKDDKGRWYLGKTKTQTGTRQIHISQTLLTALKNYKKKQLYLKRLYGKEYKYYHLENVKNEYGKIKEQRIIENDYGVLDINSVNLVFTKENGLFVGTDLLKYPFQIIHNELGITKCRFYDLRGSYATKILRNGVEIKDVADILGHSNIETTENYYISSSNESRKIAIDVFEKITFSNVIKEISNYEINAR